MQEKFNLKNLSIFLGLFGFALLFALFGFTFCSLGEQKYSLYSLFFLIDDSSLFPMGGPIFFIIFMVNFLLYLSLFMIRLTGKDPVKKLFLGYAGIAINSFNTISLFSLLFSFDDISDIIFIFITFELIGFFVVYAAWIYACKNHETKENGSLIKNKYLFFSIIELFFFMLPLAILIGILFFASNRSSANKNMKNSEPNTQFILNKDYNTITIDNKTYLVKNNKLLDFRTNKEVGYLDKDKVILKTKDD